MKALKRKWDISQNHANSYLQFRRSVHGAIGLNGAAVVQWCGMYLAIEKDGTVHS